MTTKGGSDYNKTSEVDNNPINNTAFKKQYILVGESPTDPVGLQFFVGSNTQTFFNS